MNFNELCLKRESTRNYTEEKVSVENINAIINEAMQAPSACNSQPWHFVVCQDEMAKNVSECIGGKDRGINHWSSQVSSFIVLCETKAKLMSSLNFDSQHFAQIDIGIVGASICYSAADKGIGSCVVGCFDEEKLKELLSIPDEATVRLIISLGYASKETRKKVRKEMGEITGYNKW